MPPGASLISSSGTGCTASAGAVTCDFGALQVGGSAVADLTLQPSAAGQLTLSATAALGGGQADRNPANDTATRT